MTYKKDTLYRDDATQDDRSNVDDVVDFAFDEKVASVFPDMVHRSVSGYSTILRIWQAVFAEKFANRDICVLDLGCSLGGVTLALSHIMPNAKFIAIDSSSDMIERCQTACERAGIASRVTVLRADLIDYEPSRSVDAITLNLVLQFIQPEMRLSVLEKYAKLLPRGGILAITEKVRHEPSDYNEKVIRWHEQFKRNNGYSELEIASKRAAIEDIMKIDTLKTIESRLLKVGFTRTYRVAQNLSFCSWVAIK